jgi:coenzyme F420 hydrogenase subunit beta
MEMNAAGYLRPVLHAPLSETMSRELARACPASYLGHNATEAAATKHDLWGPLLSTRTAHSSDAEIWKQGSSGGVLSALSWYLLAQGKVTGVVQIAVSTDDPLTNQVQISRSRQDIIRAAGSRYAPAAPLNRLSEWISATEERLAFVGKPCDVAALRQYLRDKPELQARFPYLLSFMCAGVPSIKGTHEVLSTMGAKAGELASFRYRGDGWPGMARAVQRDGQAFEMDYNSSWGKILGKYLQFRCKICPDGTGEFADIVCADAWYGENGYPDFAERDGRSLLLTRTAAGEALVLEAIAAGAIQASDLPVADIARMQPYQVTRKQMVLGRTIATKLGLGVAPRYHRLGLLKASMKVSPVKWLRQAWGTFRRLRLEPQ